MFFADFTEKRQSSITIKFKNNHPKLWRFNFILMLDGYNWHEPISSSYIYCLINWVLIFGNIWKFICIIQTSEVFTSSMGRKLVFDHLRDIFLPSAIDFFDFESERQVSIWHLCSFQLTREQSLHPCRCSCAHSKGSYHWAACLSDEIVPYHS